MDFLRRPGSLALCLTAAASAALYSAREDRPHSLASGPNNDTKELLDRIGQLETSLEVTRTEMLNQDRELGGRVDTVSNVTIPIGGILLWWGDELPPNFELCDGKKPTTRGAKIDRKPDFIGQFPRGAAAHRQRTEDLLAARGGKATFGATMTGTHRLTVPQLPAHTHSVIDRGHSHGVHDPGHSHRIPMGDGDAGPRDKVADGDRKEHRPVSTRSARTGVRVNSARTGVRIGSTGEGEGHAHSLAEQSNLPPYQEAFFIIRVK